MRSPVREILVAGLGAQLLVCGQTAINGGRYITGTWDASSASSTRPAKAGTTLPGSCAVGELFFRTDAAAGQNLYFCTATGIWTQMAGGGTGHAQNTDTGTAAAVFQIDSGAGGPKLKNEAGTLAIRTAGDTDYAPLKAKMLTAGDGSAQAGLVLPELAANGSNDFRIYGASDQTADGCIIVSGQPGPNQILQGTGTTAAVDGKTCRVMAWADPAAGGSGGDVSSNTATSVNGEIALFSGTTGKLIQRAGGSGVARLTSGVLGTVSGNASDCVKVDGSSGACGTGGGSGFDPFDNTTRWWMEEFVGNGVGSGYFGEHSWYYNGSSGYGAINADAPSGRVGIVSIYTASADSSWAVISINGGGQGPVAGLNSTAGWELQWTFNIESAANERVCLGFGSTSSAAAQNDAYLACFDTAIDATNWIAMTCSGGTCLNSHLTTTLGAATTTGYHRVRIFSDTAGHIKFQLDAGAIAEACNGCAGINQTPSGNAKKPMALVMSQSGGGAKVLNLDKVAFKWTGLATY